MINTEETRLPGGWRQDAPVAAETVPPGQAAPAGGQSPRLTAGESVAGSYVVSRALSDQGKQADVYLTKKWGKSYVAKLYHNGWRPSDRMRNFLANVDHPNIARVLDCGDYRGQYYEIYAYYAEGTLEQVGTCPPAQLREVVIPSVNEGLRELHKNGIVHCDIKPSNLFFSQDRQRVIIGDCGISGFANAGGKLVDTVRGTPEYAPRVKSLLWSAAMSPAYDYGSFGLVLCRLVLGRSLFHGMPVEEIAQAWEMGITLPGQIQGRMAELIRGLITEDEAGRWGYLQVKRWCEGEYIGRAGRGLYDRPKRERALRPLIFGQFEGRTVTVTTLDQLADAVRRHWEQATRVVKQQALWEFVRQFNADTAEKVRELLRWQDVDAAVFRLLGLVDGDSRGIFYRGKDYGTLADYLMRLEEGRDPDAVRFLSSGLLVQYLREQGADRQLVDKLEQLIKKNGCEDMGAICTICFAIQGRRNIRVHGAEVDSLDSLVSAIAPLTTAQISDLLEEGEVKAWLYRMGFEKEMAYMSEL